MRWVFSATSLGKQPCDKMGEAVKQLLSNASVKLSCHQVIYDIYHFCKENIKNLIFKFTSKAGVDNARVILNEKLERIII